MRESDLRKHFEHYGEVKDVQIMRDTNTGASRGFGFITFFRDDIAERLITEVQVAQIGNRRVDIRSADPKQPDRQQTQQKSSASSQRGNNNPETGDKKRDRKKRDRRGRRSRRRG